MILDPELAFVHSPELDRPEVYVPHSVIDFLEPDVLAAERLRDANPIGLPSNAAVATDEADFEVTGVFDLRKLPREPSQRRAVGRRRRLLAERFVPDAEFHLLDTGHFALEDKGDEIAKLMRDFLGRKLLRK